MKRIWKVFLMLVLAPNIGLGILSVMIFWFAAGILGGTPTGEATLLILFLGPLSFHLRYAVWFALYYIVCFGMLILHYYREHKAKAK